MYNRQIFISLGVLLILIVGVLLYRQNGTTTVILVRHAERFDDAANTNLSDAGFMRAEALAERLADVALAGVYSTNFCRTAQTVLPLVRDQKLSLNVQQISESGGFDECAPAVSVPVNALPASLNTEAAFINYVLTQHPGETILIAGHSNTVPALINELGKGAFKVDQLPHDAYSDLFTVSLPTLWGGPTLKQETYGLEEVR